MRRGGPRTGTLGVKLSLAAAVGIGVGLIILATVALVTTTRQYKHRTLNAAKTQLDLISSLAAGALVFGDAASAQDALATLRHDPRVICARLVNQTGSTLAEYRSTSDCFGQEASASHNWFLGTGVLVSGDVLQNDERLGSLHLQVETNSLWSLLARTLLVLTLAALAAGWVAYYLSRRLTDGVIAPILQLAQTARKVAETRDYSLRVEEREGGANEVVDLVTAVNELMSAVETKTASLAETNQHLRREIEARNRVEEELALAQRLEAVGRLAAGMAHELNTPLQYIGDSTTYLKRCFGKLEPLLTLYEKTAQTLKQRDQDDKLAISMTRAAHAIDLPKMRQRIEKTCDRAVRGVERASEVIKVVRKFSHPGGAKLQPTDLNQTITDALVLTGSALRPVAKVETEFAELPEVHCDASQIEQVIINLATNAADAIVDMQSHQQNNQDAEQTTTVEQAESDETTREPYQESDPPERGRIVVRTGSDTPGWVWFTLSDTGAGIPAHAQEKLFEPFFTTKEVGRGTGQGLAIVHNVVVDKHGGKVSFESNPNQGTTFRIELPVIAKEAT